MSILNRGAMVAVSLSLISAPALAQGGAQAGAAKPAQPPTGVSDPSAGPHTLAEARAITYANNPALQAERARLRATDENVPQALAGWRPQITIAATAGVAGGITRQSEPVPGQVNPFTGAVTPATTENISEKAARDDGTAQVTVTQPIYRGGRTRANTNRAENQVMGERANLISQEQTTFINVVNAYVNVIQQQQVLQLNINNEQVLARQLQATNDRFRVGEITRTDVAQAEAALAGATATRQTSEGNLATARSTYQQVIGYLPPGDLAPPQPLALPVKSQQEALTIAAGNNPAVVAALFNDAAAKDAVDVAYSALMPNLSLQGQTFGQINPSLPRSQTNGYAVTANLTIPVYQGGSEYSAIRQAKQTQQQTRKLIDDARRTAMQQATQAWETLVAARATAESTRSQIRANRIALEGVEREAIVGSRTTLDVLNAQQALLQSEVNLVQNLASLVTASYSVAQALGRLTARDLNLAVPLYDETAYYSAVRDKWFGTGDHATDQPGR
jgi:outer membrane protein